MLVMCSVAPHERITKQTLQRFLLPHLRVARLSRAYLERMRKVNARSRISLLYHPSTLKLLLSFHTKIDGKHVCTTYHDMVGPVVSLKRSGVLQQWYKLLQFSNERQRAGKEERNGDTARRGTKITHKKTEHADQNLAVTKVMWTVKVVV